MIPRLNNIAIKSGASALEQKGRQVLKLHAVPRNLSNLAVSSDNSAVSMAARAYAQIEKLSLTQIAAQVNKLIEEADSIIILGPKIIDSDTVSSTLALLSNISERFPDKKVQVCLPSAKSEYLQKIPYAYNIKYKLPRGERFDLAIAVNLNRAEMDPSFYFRNAKNRVFIDNKYLKKGLKNGLRLIKPEAPSVASIIKDELFDASGIKVSSDTQRYIDARLSVDEAIKNKEFGISNSTNPSAENVEASLSESTSLSADELYFNYFRSNNELHKKCKNVINFLLSQEAQATNTSETSHGLKIKQVLLSQKMINEQGLKDVKSSVVEDILKVPISKLSKFSDLSLAFYEVNDSLSKVFMRSRKLDLDFFAQSCGGDYHGDGFASVEIRGSFKNARKEFFGYLNDFEF